MTASYTPQMSKMLDAALAEAHASAQAAFGKVRFLEDLKRAATPRLICFWDAENVQMKRGYTTASVGRVIMKFCGSYASDCRVIAAANLGEYANRRLLELKNTPGFDIREAKIGGRPDKLNTADQLLIRVMSETLLNTQDYDYVVVITGDSDFSDPVKGMISNNPRRKWILVHGSNASDVLTGMQEWNAIISFGSLFRFVKTDYDPKPIGKHVGKHVGKPQTETKRRTEHPRAGSPKKTPHVKKSDRAVIEPRIVPDSTDDDPSEDQVAGKLPEVEVTFKVSPTGQVETEFVFV